MIRLNEPADTYHAIPAFSAGLAWDIVGPDGCLAMAYARSRWLNPNYEPERDEAMDSGVIAHLATLEEEKLDAAIVLVHARDWRSKAAREVRDEAYAQGKIPILAEREPGSTGTSFQKVLAMRRALQANPVTNELLFGPGNNEVSYDWVDEVGGVHCKARADRVVTNPGEITKLIDLKTAQSVSPDGFQRSMMRYGHHLRCAFYLDGWDAQDGTSPLADYIFACVRSEPPHLVAVYALEAQAIEWGRKLYRKALVEFEVAHAGGMTWWGYTRDVVMPIDLPTWAGYRLADREAAGEL